MRVTRWAAEDLASKRLFFEVINTTPESQMATMVLKEGEVSGPMGSDHRSSDQIAVVLEGGGTLRTGEDEVKLAQGDVVIIPARLDHQFLGPSKTLNIYAPPAYSVDDKERKAPTAKQVEKAEKSEERARKKRRKPSARANELQATCEERLELSIH